MANERLRSRMIEAGLTATDVATVVEVDPKTVDRWVSSGRVPHSRHRAATALALDTEETDLWPELLDDARTRAASQAEVLMVYPHRGAVPPELWRRLVEEAETQVDILVFAGLFLIDSNPDLPEVLAERAQDGLQARLLFGDPDSEVVAWRGQEEGIGDDLASRIRLSLKYMDPVVGTPGIEVRQHETILYSSLYRFDDELLVNTHVVGSPAGQNPVIHIRKIQGGRLFDHYRTSFDRVWDRAAPLESSRL